MSEVIVDIGSSDNVVSKKLVKSIGRKLAGIRKGSKTKTTKVCKVPLSIGKHYQDEVSYDDINLDVCHVLLDRLRKMTRIPFIKVGRILTLLIEIIRRQ